MPLATLTNNPSFSLVYEVPHTFLWWSKAGFRQYTTYADYALYVKLPLATIPSPLFICRSAELLQYHLHAIYPKINRLSSDSHRNPFSVPSLLEGDVVCPLLYVSQWVFMLPLFKQYKCSLGDTYLHKHSSDCAQIPCAVTPPLGSIPAHLSSAPTLSWSFALC